MARKKEAPAEPNNSVSRNIVSEMKESYLDYAMSVITARALPDVRDGLKPVQRRVLYTMHQMGVSSGSRPRKSAAIVGDVMGKYHPHGDSAIYDSMVKMAQPFGYRYPLVLGQGNFGSIDGDPPAAMRYTEARLTKLSSEMLTDLEKETVDWRPNYDGSKEEPVVLPAAAPNLLLNGTLGIAVGMATNIAPHNLREVVSATIHLIDNEDATTDDLMQFVKGPDFPLGGIAYNKSDIKHAYANGKGGVVCRGDAVIEEGKKGQFQITITSLPFRVNKADLIVKIADLVRSKKLEGIKDLRDESTDDIRIVIDLKSSGHPQKVLNYLYKHTQLEDTFHFNMVALDGGVPQTLSLKGILESFIAHREDVIRKRSEYELKKAKDREHILLGLSTALDHIDEIIALIKKSKDGPTAHAALVKRFKFSDRQATAILEMRLQRLSGLERQKILDELKDIKKRISELESILGSKKKLMGIVKDELVAVSEKYGDDRRTKIVGSGVKNITLEDTIPDEESILVLTQGGYIKRTNPSEYRAQRRGGTGVIDLNTKEEDFVTTFLTASTHSDVLFFTNKGKVYQIKMYDVPEGKRATKGKSIMNFLSLSGEEQVTSVLEVPKDFEETDVSLLLVTESGVAKKVAARSFTDVRRSGIIAIKLKGDDVLISARFVRKKDSVAVVTTNGQSIRFDQSDLRQMGRSAGGVRAISLSSGDRVIAANVVQSTQSKRELFVMGENGYGKKTPISEYKVQKRGGSGIKTMSVSSKTGKVMASRVVSEEDEEIIAISKKGQVIRVALSEIPTLGRSTQGVRIMKLKTGDSIASLICL